MAKSKYPFLSNGYIYSPTTRAGFLRMKRQGIPRPLFSIQDKLAALLRTKYRALTRKLLKDLREQLRFNNIVMDAAPEDDNLEGLLDFFDKMGKELQEENEKVIARINLNTVANTLEHQWLEEESEQPEFFVKSIAKTFEKEQEDYLKRLYDDADDKFKRVLISFSIDKQQFFNDNLDAVRQLYLDNSIARIKGEEMLIKQKVLNRIVNYATGQTDKLELADLVKEGYEDSDHLARLFARDQMQRFNKACTLATFKGAGVTKVKWVTAGDIRVRESHRALNGQIFDVNNLPKEVDDYNCRCGLVPVEWADD